MHRLHHEYDALHRPTRLHVKTARDEAFLAEQIIYGEGLPNDLALNLRGKPVQQFDAAGIVARIGPYSRCSIQFRNSERLAAGARAV